MVIMNSPGELKFRVYLPHAQCVDLTGDFNRWTPGVQAMGADESMPERGWWMAELRLSAGEYRFAYLVNHACWMPDYAAHGVERDSDGRWVSVVKVAGSTAILKIANSRALAVRLPIPGRLAGEREAGVARSSARWPEHACAEKGPACGHPHAG